MFNFENQVCDVCGNAFDKNSDVFVCPDCGTPHHRECWHKLGHCVNQDKHRSGFEWQPVKQEAAASSITCTKCGSIMPEGTLFCENCGNALANPQQNQPVQSYTTPGGGRIEVHQFPPMDFGQEEFRRRVEMCPILTPICVNTIIIYSPGSYGHFRLYLPGVFRYVDMFLCFDDCA